MNASSHTNAQDIHRSAKAAGILSDITAVLVNLGIKVASKAKSALRAMQMAKMVTTLSNLTDQQLSEVGITRSEIPKYAKDLMAES